MPYVPPVGFWRSVRQACDDFGALLIFDEIPTGLGKTGKMFACEHDGVVPDMLVIGKSLGGGVLPIAALVCRPELDVCRFLRVWPLHAREEPGDDPRGADHASDHRGGASGGERAARVGDVGLGLLKEMMDRHPLIGDVRGRGCLLGAELVLDRGSRAPAADAADAVLYKALSRGLNFKTTMGNVLTLTPPLITTEVQMRKAMEIIEESIDEVEQELGMGRF